MQARPIPERYLEPIQSRAAAPTPYEDLLGDAIERIYAAGIHDLQGVIGALNATGPGGPNGQPWTEASFTAEFARLGE
jgi:hypothetical protein